MPLACWLAPLTQLGPLTWMPMGIIGVCVCARDRGIAGGDPVFYMNIFFGFVNQTCVNLSTSVHLNTCQAENSITCRKIDLAGWSCNFQAFLSCMSLYKLVQA